MASTGTVHVGDIGTHYQARLLDAGAPFDPSAATSAKLVWKPPAAPALERDATITTDGTYWYLTYQLVEGVDDAFHTQAGVWWWQGYVAFADGQRYHTTSEAYIVSGNLGG